MILGCNVQKLHPKNGDQNPMAQNQLRGHTILLPLKPNESYGTRVTALPRTDIPKWLRIMFHGEVGAQRLAAIQNRKNMSFRYDVSMQYLRLLGDLSDEYRDVVLKTREECGWEEQKDKIYGIDSILVADDPISLALEQISQSDVAGSWVPSNPSHLALQQEPVMQHVMVAQESAHVDTDAAVLRSLQKQLGEQKNSEGENALSTFDLNIGGEGVNEFLDGHRILGQAHPCLFPLGVTPAELTTTALMPLFQRRRLLYQHDGRYARDPQFGFSLLSQLLRHATTHIVKAHLRSGSKDVKEFIELANESGFSDLLDASVKDRTTPEAKRLIAKIMPLLRVTGVKLPWSHHERRRSISHLYAISQNCGLPFVFITFCPKVIEN